MFIGGLYIAARLCLESYAVAGRRLSVGSVVWDRPSQPGEAKK